MTRSKGPVKPTIKNVVQLSDGRMVCVEAEHDGEITVTLVQGDQPPGAYGWGVLSHRIITHEQWERDRIGLHVEGDDE